MDKLRLRNYRCLEDTGEVEIKPLTLLVGANSSGKSSFLKFFPLLKQSVGERVNGVFLWNGEYVDFENFNKTVKNGQNSIEIEYVIEKMNGYKFDGPNLYKDIHITIEISKDGGEQDYLKRVTICNNEINATYNFNSDTSNCEIIVNTISSNDVRDVISVRRGRELLPMLSFMIEDKYFEELDFVSKKAHLEALKLIDVKATGNELSPNLIGALSKAYIKRYIEKKLRKSRLQNNNLNIDYICNLILYSNAVVLYREVNHYFTDLAYDFKYVGPLRANMERYYRFQNKDVEEIAPDGDNFAMFVSSLKANKNKKIWKDYNKWLLDLFHFTIDLSPSLGHIELKIQEYKEDGDELIKNKESMNLVDVGFGYTQILPIITVIWQTIYNLEGRKTSQYCNLQTIAIEQPELHLHPRFQRDFAYMLAQVIKRYKNDVRIIVETHSEYIINAMGRYIRKYDISSDDVNVVLFNAQEEGMDSYVHSTKFDYNGILDEWPYGFF